MTIKEMKSADLETLLNRMCRLYMSERKWAAEEMNLWSYNTTIKKYRI